VPCVGMASMEGRDQGSRLSQRLPHVEGRVGLKAMTFPIPGARGGPQPSVLEFQHPQPLSVS